MPDEVFDMWIGEDIAHHGWPLSGDQQTFMPDSTWAKHLRNRSLHYWSSVTWERLSLKFSDIVFEPQATRNAKYLAEHWRDFSQTGTAKATPIKNSHERLVALAPMITHERKFPKPIICFVENIHWLLLDGTHRLGIVLSLKKHEDFQCDIWLGKHAL